MIDLGRILASLQPTTMPKVIDIRKTTPFRGILLLLFIATFALGLVGPAFAKEQERHALVAEVDGAINPVTQRFIGRVIEKGEKSGAEIVIIKLNTPGGLLSSTKKIVQDLLNASVPTAVYVYPSGADAASAGTFITAAANFAVMAPGTTIGAASPVGGGGEDIPETLKSKVVENLTALMRNIAEERGRNAEALEETVTNARAYDTKEAVELNVVDFIAEDIASLLREIDGDTVEIRNVDTGATESRTLNTQDLKLRDINMTFIETFLFLLADPNIAFLLLSIGGLGIVVEVFNPGLIFPGVLGVILLLLAFVSLGTLPVNWAAVGFILLAGVLLVAEFFISGFGILGILAIVSFIFGGLLLFSGFGTPSPTEASVKVNLVLLGSIAGAFTLFGFWFFHTIVQARRASRRQVQAPLSPLIGALGTATTDLAPRGTVQLEDEMWTAVTEGDIVIETGEKIRVLKVDGTILTVGRAEEQAV